MRTRVLNAGYEPLAVVSFKRALVLVMNEKATVIERMDGNPVWGIRGASDRPAVIVLTRYVRVPGARRVPVTRRGVLRRDAHRCAYCGKGATTIAHVLPRSPQGRPVIVQAGSSETGRELAAQTAEVVFTAQTSLAAAQ